MGDLDRKKSSLDVGIFERRLLSVLAWAGNTMIYREKSSAINLFLLFTRYNDTSGETGPDRHRIQVTGPRQI